MATDQKAKQKTRRIMNAKNSNNIFLLLLNKISNTKLKGIFVFDILKQQKIDS